MSIEAMSHILGCEVGDTTRKLVLFGLSNHADKDGEDAWPSVETLATYAECSTRTVQRALTALLDDGFIREGDQDVPRAKIKDPARKKYAPINYDIAMSERDRLLWKHERGVGPTVGRRAASAAAGKQGAALTNAGATDCRPSINARGDTGDTSGATPTTPRGDTGVAQTVQEPSKGTVQSNTSPSPDGEDGCLFAPETVVPPTPPTTGVLDVSFTEFYAAYPKKTGKADAEKAWHKALVRLAGSMDVEAAAALILAGARRFAADPNLPAKGGPDWTYVKHPATWLNKGCWDDEPLPPRGKQNSNLHVDDDRGPRGSDGFN